MKGVGRSAQMHDTSGVAMHVSGSPGEGLFAGRLDFTKLPFTGDTLIIRVLVALGIFPRSDHRDWNAIHSRAKGLISLLG
jgi:hypothetical protein